MVWIKANIELQFLLMLHDFCRDVDIPLTEKGVMDALAGGRAISEIDFDIIFTSRLVRSKQTALIAMTQVRTSFCSTSGLSVCCF